MAMSDSLDRVLEFYFSLPKARRDAIHRRSSPMDDLCYISLLMRKNRVHDAIEIGTFMGLSACFIASNITGTLYTYNINAAEVEMAKATVSDAGIRNVQFIVGDSLEMLPLCPALKNGKLNAAYIDGHHSYWYSMGEYKIVAPHIKDGLILFDDAAKLHPDGSEDGGVLRTVKELDAISIRDLGGRVAYKLLGHGSI